MWPIEEKIHKNPAVFDACVYGEMQSDGSQLPAAAIALRPGFKIVKQN
jgi:acyl-CoA synthetase (AMP-forming)/AMP-acid ligase II